MSCRGGPCTKRLALVFPKLDWELVLPQFISLENHQLSIQRQQSGLSYIGVPLGFGAHSLLDYIRLIARQQCPGRSLCDLAQDGCASCARVRGAFPIVPQDLCALYANLHCFRLTEEVLHESTDARTEVLAALRELGPPDLVQLIKQAPRSQGKQVCLEL